MALLAEALGVRFGRHNAQSREFAHLVAACRDLAARPHEPLPEPRAVAEDWAPKPCIQVSEYVDGQLAGSDYISLWEALVRWIECNDAPRLYRMVLKALRSGRIYTDPGDGINPWEWDYEVIDADEFETQLSFLAAPS